MFHSRARNAMAAANTLLLRYNLELPRAEGGGAGEESLRARYGHRLLGRSAAALPLTWKLVSSILGEFFFVECLWVPTFNARKLRVESLLEVMGTRENLEMADFVHDYLHGAVDRVDVALEEGRPGPRRVVEREDLGDLVVDRRRHAGSSVVCRPPPVQGSTRPEIARGVAERDDGGVRRDSVGGPLTRRSPCLLRRSCSPVSSPASSTASSEALAERSP